MKSRNDVLSVQLAIAFSDESEIPAKYKKGTNRRRFQSDDKKTNIEEEFNKKIADWKLTVDSIFEELPINDAFRFVTITPGVNEDDTQVTTCEDFQIFHEYLIQRRDIDNCSDGELGCLSMLFTEFQREIERILSGEYLEKKRTELKNKDAQMLLEQGQIKVDGVELNLWQGHSFDNVSVQQGWNKVKSFTEMNQKTEGENGSVVFTGVMQIPRQEAEDYALSLGFKVHSMISKKVNYVVAGSENVSPTKIAKVVELQKQGALIKVISEIEFLEMVAEFI